MRRKNFIQMDGSVVENNCRTIFLVYIRRKTQGMIVFIDVYGDKMVYYWKDYIDLLGVMVYNYNIHKRRFPCYDYR